MDSKHNKYKIQNLKNTIKIIVQLALIPSNQTYSGDRELTQYFIRWFLHDNIYTSGGFYMMIMDDTMCAIRYVSRQTSMQLAEDNSTISVKVIFFQNNLKQLWELCNIE